MRMLQMLQTITLERLCAVVFSVVRPASFRAEQAQFHLCVLISEYFFLHNLIH